MSYDQSFSVSSTELTVASATPHVRTYGVDDAGNAAKGDFAEHELVMFATLRTLA